MRKDCKQTDCKYFNTCYEANCSLDRCVYVHEGKAKEGTLRADQITEIIQDMTDDDLLEFAEEFKHDSILSEEPVPIREFIRSPFYLDIQDDGYVWEENVKILEELFSGKYREGFIIGGIGMGKSTLSALAILYIVYRILIVKDPHQCYRMVANSPIEIVILSLNETLAKDVIFRYCMNFCMNSQFFKNKEYAPNPEIKSVLQFPKNISVTPLSGAKTAGISRNVIFGVMDEASFYTNTNNSCKATMQYNNLTRRIKSRFEKANLHKDLLRGMLLAISSPAFETDFMETMVKKKMNDPTVYTRRVSGFDTKPLGTYSGRSFLFCQHCRKVVQEDHIRKGIDIVVPNKHERKA